MKAQQLELLGKHFDKPVDALVWLAKNWSSQQLCNGKDTMYVEFSDVRYRSHISVLGSFGILEDGSVTSSTTGITFDKEALVKLDWDDRYAIMTLVTQHDRKNLRNLEDHKMTKKALSDVGSGMVEYTDGNKLSRTQLFLVLNNAYKQTSKVQARFEKRVRKFLDI